MDKKLRIITLFFFFAIVKNSFGQSCDDTNANIERKYV